VRIKDIIKQNQPREYSKLEKHSKDEKLTEKDIKKLMGHSSYKRGPGGAIKQIR
jgi:hypothetical protein